MSCDSNLLVSRRTRTASVPVVRFYWNRRPSVEQFDWVASGVLIDCVLNQQVSLFEKRLRVQIAQSLLGHTVPNSLQRQTEDRDVDWSSEV